MKIKALFLSALFIVQACALSASAATAPFSSIDSSSGLVDADANLKVIGPLHMSEGRVLVKQNQIYVLSDPQDSIAEAELSGVLIDCRLTGDAESRRIHGYAVFTKGFSLPALFQTGMQESVLATDGLERKGTIVDLTPSLLRIKTGAGIQILQTSKITSIKSARAFEFDLPVSLAGAADRSIDPAASGKAESSLVSFSPSNPPDPSTVVPVIRAPKTLQAQLTERHLGKRILTAGAVTAAVVACFAIPTAIAVITPRPKHQIVTTDPTSGVTTVDRNFNAARRRPIRSSN